MRKVLLDRRLKKAGPVGFLETHWLIVGLGLRRNRPGGTILTLGLFFRTQSLGGAASRGLDDLMSLR